MTRLGSTGEEKPALFVCTKREKRGLIRIEVSRNACFIETPSWKSRGKVLENLFLSKRRGSSTAGAGRTGALRGSVG